MSRTAELVSWVASLAVLVATGPGTLALAKNAPEAPKEAWVTPGVSVLVCDQAQVPWQILDRAEREAARIFHSVGIELTWRNCNPAMTGIHQEANCTHEVGPTELILRIVPEIAVVSGVTHDTMGFAFANFASVSFCQVETEAAKFGIGPYLVLGPAIAHELGHLLLGQHGHSPTGIMRARWQRRDYEAPTLGAFKFNAEQAGQMRAEVRERERQQGAEVLEVPGPLARTAAQTPGGGPESQGQPADNRESDVRITLRIFNYAHVAPTELTRAEHVAAAIFRKAGIETMWMDCPVSPEEVDRFPACQRPWATSDFALRFVSQPLAERRRSQHDLGWALPCVDGQQGCYSYVFYELAKQWAERCDTSTDQILGHAIAHEVGHLLLGPDSHSRSGVMRGDWSMDDLAAMARTFLYFTPTQCERLQRNVSARMRDHAGTLASRGL